jgi:hypothetical protein
MTDFNAVDGYYPTALRWAYFVVMDEPRISPYGYERRFGPRRWYDRSTPESRPSSGNVRFLGLEVRSTSDNRSRWARSAKTEFDPRRKLHLCLRQVIATAKPLKSFNMKYVANIH